MSVNQEPHKTVPRLTTSVSRKINLSRFDPALKYESVEFFCNLSLDCNMKPGTDPGSQVRGQLAYMYDILEHYMSIKEHEIHAAYKKEGQLSLFDLLKQIRNKKAQMGLPTY